MAFRNFVWSYLAFYKYSLIKHHLLVSLGATASEYDYPLKDLSGLFSRHIEEWSTFLVEKVLSLHEINYID